MFRNTLFILSALLLAMSANQAMAQGGNTECPVGLVDKDSGGNYLTPDDKFGAGTSEIMNCVKSRTNVKMVIQDNAFCRDAVADADCGAGRAYALAQAYSIIRDYEVTHGMQAGVDYEIAIVAHGGGGKHLLDRPFNQYRDNVRDLMSKGVKFYFCMNTVRGMQKKQLAGQGMPFADVNNPTGSLIEGVEYVTGGLTAIADMQKQGYVYIQP
jgi:intracellular sulfur oxidation DsrE/DsrF family protein